MMEAQTQQQARVHSRVGVRWQAVCHWSSGESVPTTILDASPSGVFLQSGDGPRRVGKDVQVRCHPMTLERQPRPIDVEGTVRWAGFSHRHGCAGMGIQLRDGSPTLESYLPSQTVFESYPGRTPKPANFAGSLWADGLWGDYDILVASHDPDVLECLTRATDGHPHLMVRSVQSGAAALEATLRDVPDFLIVDVNLPDIDGRDILSRLTRRGLTERALVLMIAQGDSQWDRRLALELGAIDYEVKPLHPGRILRKIEFLLEKYDSRTN